jgi:antitoxin component of RelBE/YafQ-DinJ toxin-antitoxin module
MAKRNFQIYVDEDIYEEARKLTEPLKISNVIEYLLRQVVNSDKMSFKNFVESIFDPAGINILTRINEKKKK